MFTMCWHVFSPQSKSCVCHIFNVFLKRCMKDFFCLIQTLSSKNKWHINTYLHLTKREMSYDVEYTWVYDISMVICIPVKHLKQVQAHTHYEVVWRHFTTPAVTCNTVSPNIYLYFIFNVLQHCVIWIKFHHLSWCIMFLMMTWGKGLQNSSCLNLYYNCCFIKYWMVKGQNIFLICCYVVNHPALSGRLGQVCSQFSESEVNIERQLSVFKLHISGKKSQFPLN